MATRVPEFVTVPFGGASLAFLSHLDIVLDVRTLIKIRNGQVVKWQHADITALNPKGPSGVVIAAPITGAPHAIQILTEPDFRFADFTNLMQSLSAKYPPPLVVPHPLLLPGGGGGTWSTQYFSLQLIVLLCG